MKQFKNFKQHHFLIGLIASTIFLTLLAHAGKKNIYADYSVDLIKVPQLAVVFQGATEGNYPWTINRNNVSAINTEVTINSNRNSAVVQKPENNLTDNKGNDSFNDVTADKITNNKDNSSESRDNPSGKDKHLSDNKGNSSGNRNNHSDEKGNSFEKEIHLSDKDNSSGNKKTSPDEKNKSSYENDNPSHNNDDKEKTNTDEKDNVSDKSKKGSKEKGSYQFVTVDEDYFKDALFIGDSRTVGLSEYSGWTEPTYFADVGLTIYDIFEKKIAKVDGKKVTIDKALEKKQYGKIYIMLGINELGRGTKKTFVNQYKKVLDKIRSLQPDAIIFIEGIMNVTKKKSDSDPIFNNKNIKDRNAGIAKLADNKNIFYIDVNKAITDDSGCIPEKYTFDSIHLKAAYYKIWTDFLLNHGIVK
ncbi:MAG: SGNH-hydro domain-containing protein [Lachnoclostridium sp.]|jgi:hypothetical protein